MRITILAPHLRLSGGNRILFTYANHLAARGHHVTVYVRSSNRVRRTVANLLQIGKPNWLRSAFRVTRVPKWDSQYVAQSDYLIAGSYNEAVAIIDWQNAQSKWYFVQHDEGLYHGDRTLVDQALSSSLKKIVVSTWLQDVVKKYSGQTAQLLINPYDKELFFPVTRPPNQDQVNILMLDHSYPWKGTSEAIALVRDLQKTHPQIQLVGMGRRRKEAKNLYDEYHFDPPQEKLRDIYSNADVFLCMSWDEGFGLPSLEAMACGTAVVTYDNGGSRDFAFDDDTAFVAPRKNQEVIREKLVEAITNPDKRNEIAQAGCVFVEQMPTWEEQVTKFEEMLLDE